MSTLVTNTITGLSTASNITIGSTPVVSASANSLTIRGEGSAQTSVQQGLAKGFLNYNQTGPATDDSFKVSGVTDNTTGTFTPAYTSNYGSVNYSCSGMCNTTMFVCLEDGVTETSATTTANAKMLAMQHNGTLLDCEQTMVVWHGDLA